MRIPSCIDLLPCHLFVSHVLIFFSYMYTYWINDFWFLISDFWNDKINRHFPNRTPRDNFKAYEIIITYDRSFQRIKIYPFHVLYIDNGVGVPLQLYVIHVSFKRDFHNCLTIKMDRQYQGTAMEPEDFLSYTETFSLVLINNGFCLFVRTL